MDEDFDKLLTIITVPILTELFILLVFLQSSDFGMFLNESHENSCCPLFSVEVKEFRCTFSLRLIDVIVKIRIGEINNHSD